MSCEKAAELIEMQFVTLSRVGLQGTCITWGVDAPAGRGTFAVSG